MKPGKQVTTRFGIVVRDAVVRLWRDERAYVQSSELILISTIAIIGLLVGLAAYRDALVSELNDTGQAIGSVNQSYNVQITSATGGGAVNFVTVFTLGTTVTIEGVFDQLTSTNTFANYSYADQTDACDDFAIVFPSTAIDEEDDTFP